MARSTIAATGGIVRYPTRAVIGEAGPEAVIPLSGHALRDFLPSAGPIRVELAHHGRVFTELVIDNLRGVAVARGLA